MNTSAIEKSAIRIAVGMSGGVDSTMTAGLLQREGYQVIGLTMQIWDETLQWPDEGRSGCFGPGEVREIEEAKALAARFGIPHHTIPLADEYRRYVLDYFRTEYREGRTPNPCVVCNSNIKFGFLLDRAREQGIQFDYFATGHYARTEYDPVRQRYLLKRGVDPHKDQSYFLARLKQEQLKQLILPLGGYSKQDIKKLARELGFPELADKPESQDFIECDDYATLFEPTDIKPGPIVDRTGLVLGEHKGIIYYTIGQRKNLGISGHKEPLYVVSIDAPNNTVVVGPHEALFGVRLTAQQINWIGIDALRKPLRITAKIRQQHKEAGATLAPVAGDAHAADVTFDQPQMSIAPGQAVVFYNGDEVLGGGTITLDKAR